jgi:hypothetical protein
VHTGFPNRARVACVVRWLLERGAIRIGSIISMLKSQTRNLPRPRAICAWLLFLSLACSVLVAQPTNVSVTPASASGATQNFAITASSSGGWANVSWVALIVNSGLTATNACYAFVQQSYSVLYLAADSGGAGGNGAVGSPGTLENSQCRVDLGASSVSGSGNNWTVTLAITSKAGFSGVENLYMAAGDFQGGRRTGSRWAPGR